MWEVIGSIIVVILVVIFFATLIGMILYASATSIGIGVFISVFAGFYSAIKNCVIGIKDSVSNMFLKVTLFVAIGLVIAGILFALVYGILLMVGISLF